MISLIPADPLPLMLEVHSDSSGRFESNPKGTWDELRELLEIGTDTVHRTAKTLGYSSSIARSKPFILLRMPSGG